MLRGWSLVSLPETPKARNPVDNGTTGLSVASEGFEPSKLARRIYSPLPLAARATRLISSGKESRPTNSQDTDTLSAPHVAVVGYT